MSEPADVAEAVAHAESWNERVALVRRVPEEFGAHNAKVYAAIAERAYVPSLRPDFGYVHWRPEYELDAFVQVYERALAATDGFRVVDAEHLTNVIRNDPATLRVFRLLVGLIPSEFAEVCSETADGLRVGKGTIESIERGKSPKASVARACAIVIDRAMNGDLFPADLEGTGLRSKQQKPDTAEGWGTVQHHADHGVSLAVLLHQRLYGGAFRQLLDSTSRARADLLEQPVEDLLTTFGIPFIRTGAHNQAEIELRFGMTVRPAPDFLLTDDSRAIRGMLECTATNDARTARESASRYTSLRNESRRLGGVPVLAVLSGTGWRHARDALGPVVRDTDGRVFTLATLDAMLSVDPFPQLRKK